MTKPQRRFFKETFTLQGIYFLYHITGEAPNSLSNIALTIISRENKSNILRFARIIVILHA